jgi:hypothetical protein
MKSNGRTKQIDFGDFIPTEDSVVKRAAQFLNWAAINMPHRFVPYTWIAKHSVLETRLPSPGSKMAIEAHNRMSAIKHRLWMDYGRRTLPAPRDQVPGCRATTDSDDLAGTVYITQTKRVAGGIKAMDETREKINVHEMRSQDLKSLVVRTDPVLKQLVRANLMEKLALPQHRADDD